MRLPTGLIVPSNLIRLVADARDTLECAELFDRRVRSSPRASTTQTRRWAELRESEIRQAEEYLRQAKVELSLLTPTPPVRANRAAPAEKQMARLLPLFRRPN